MSGTTGRIDDDGFAEAVAIARDLVSRLASDLEVRGHEEAAATTLQDAVAVLGNLVPRTVCKAPVSDQGPDAASSVILDVSDLLGYFEHNRLPTGIQRVQAELIAAILQSDHCHATQLCCFVQGRDQWVRVNSDRFIDVCAQSRSGGDPLEPGWMEAVQGLRSMAMSGKAMVFPENAILVNVGSSWWIPNYFVYVRQAKTASSVRYVPLIYDLIPVLTPENCAPELVGEFITWLISVLDHADYYLAISQATRKDLLAFAQKLGRPIAADRVEVIPLDADFRSAEKRPLPTMRRFAEPFVLFVSTLEARKNQLGALDAWAALIARRGAARVPRLVLVGKRGFKSDVILSRLEANADLRERVTILSGIEDVELQALYRDCLFTIYPSLYEGWGLPVTESLCHGKVPLIADNSSLPEAGGPLALYFKTGSTAAMTAMIERLITDSGFREEREKMIRDGFRPREWDRIAGDVLHYIERWTAILIPKWQPPPVQPHTYYPMSWQHSPQIWPGMGSAEQFRAGFGWYTIEGGGCWMRSSGAELALRLPGSATTRMGFELICPGGRVMTYRIEVLGHPQAVTGRIRSGLPKWAFLDMPSATGGDLLHIRLTTVVVAQSPDTSNNDPRDLGIGLRGFFVFGDEAASRVGFLEAVALGALPDLDAYRDRSLDAGSS